MPAVFFLLFGTNGSYRTERVGDGNVTGYILISMAVYGAMLATTSRRRDGLDRTGRRVEPAAAADPAASRSRTSR